jgi:nitroreductase
MAVVICGLPEVSDVWVEDCSIASILVQLYAETVPGMGSCWVQIRNRKHDPSTSSQEFVRSVLGLAGDRSVESIIALGYEAERGDPIAVEELPGGKVRRNAEGSPQ